MIDSHDSSQRANIRARRCPVGDEHSEACSVIETDRVLLLVSRARVLMWRHIWLPVFTLKAEETRPTTATRTDEYMYNFTHIKLTIIMNSCLLTINIYAFREPTKTDENKFVVPYMKKYTVLIDWIWLPSVKIWKYVSYDRKQSK